MRLTLLLLASLAIGQGSALAADRLDPDIAPERFGWTGFYVGASAGYGWLEDVDYAPPPGLPSPLYDEGKDWVFGGHAGYLHQFGDFVVGAEAEVMRLDIAYDFFDFITIDYAAAVKGRIGYAWDRTLFTAHGGAVYASTNFNDLADWGWVAGAGIDYALTDTLTIGAQYSHYDFKEFDGTRIDATIDLLTARVGVKF
jgi:outer membrane immunogenic protein